jgi:hypothetical protein
MEYDAINYLAGRVGEEVGGAIENALKESLPTLRDQFAMAALTAIIQLKPTYADNPEASMLACDCEAAYQYADAMMEARR